MGEEQLLALAAEKAGNMNPLQYIPEIFQFVQGYRQNKMAKDMLAKIVRPKQEIPTAVTQGLNIARNLASTNEMPGQYNAEQKLNQQLAGGVYNATNTAASPAEALAAAVALNGNRMGAQNDLAGQAAQFHYNAQNNFANALDNYGNWQNKVWETNMFDKYLTDSATASALRQAGQTNMFNAISNGVGVATAKGTNKDELTDLISKIKMNTGSNSTNPNGSVNSQDIEKLKTILGSYNMNGGKSWYGSDFSNPMEDE
jgi:hypothetical protein